jgi:hypothetical protein
MKKLTIAALLAGQVAATAQPALAADFAATQEQRAGAFAGFRVRMPLDGPQRRELRAGLTLAPTLQSRAIDGETRTRIGEGLEFGYRSNRPLSFSLAGQDLNGRRFGAAQGDDDHHGLSTGEILLIAGGVIVVTAGVVAVAFLDAIDDSSD